MIHYKITPDHQIENRGVEQMLKTMNDYKSPLQRWNGKGFDRSSFLSYEICMEKENTSFHVTIPDELDLIGKKAMETAWPHAKIEPGEDPFCLDPHSVSRIELKMHPMFAIRVDRRENRFIHTLMETIKIMQLEDKIFLQVLCVPAALDWYYSSAEAYKKFTRDGIVPRKLHMDGKELAKEGVKLMTRGVLGVIDGIVAMTGGTPEKINLDDADRAMMMRDGGLRSETLQKTKCDAYDVTIRVAIQSKNHENIMKIITSSFREFDGDNHFISYPMDTSDMVLGWFKQRKPGFKVAKDYLSTPELARIVQMPNNLIQTRWNMERIGSLETAIPKPLTKGGILIGSHTQKGAVHDVHMPVDDWDELCLPRVVIGGMGQGKTKGFGANWMYQAIKNGFGGLVIDPAKGEIGKELASVLDESKIYRINVSETPICLDWCEVEQSPHARNRLANTMISFFNTSADDAGAQTQRYIRAMVLGMQGNKLTEIVRMMNDMAYLTECVDRMADGFHKATLQELLQYTDGRRIQILSPIMNRLDMILGDTFLSECMDSDRSLDMVDIMNMKKVIVIDVPKRDVGPEGVDVIVNLLSTKIDLAMSIRSDNNQTPFFILFDEPHQYMRSHQIWKSAAVESRKWRVGFIWMFHEWTQIDDKLRRIMKSALPHYHVYPSSKGTFQDLKEELHPFTLDDFMKLKRWTAINVIRTGGQSTTPFVAQMTPPPSEQHVVKEENRTIIHWTIPQ